MTNRPPIAPSDPEQLPCPPEAPCRDPEGPRRADPEYAPPAPDRCVPDEGSPEAPCPDDAPAPDPPGHED